LQFHRKRSLRSRRPLAYSADGEGWQIRAGEVTAESVVKKMALPHGSVKQRSHRKGEVAEALMAISGAIGTVGASKAGAFSDAPAIPKVDVDPFSTEFFENPHPGHEIMREAAPVVRF